MRASVQMLGGKTIGEELTLLRQGFKTREERAEAKAKATLSSEQW